MRKRDSATIRIIKMDELDQLIKEKISYTDVIPARISTHTSSKELVSRILEAEFFGNHVVVDPIPSGGHANAPQMKGAKAHKKLAYPFLKMDGLDYKITRRRDRMKSGRYHSAECWHLHVGLIIY